MDGQFGSCIMNMNRLCHKKERKKEILLNQIGRVNKTKSGGIIHTWKVKVI